MARDEGTPQGGPLTPLTQKVIWPASRTWRWTTALRSPLRDRNAVADCDGVVPYEDILHHEPYDSLALNDA
jgi:hypothetical protein